MSDFEARIEAFERAFHHKLDTIILAVHHLLTKGSDAMDHAALLDLAKKTDAVLDEKVNAAVSEFQAFEATHAAVADALDDVGTVLTGMQDKLAKLDAIKADPPVAPVAEEAPAPALSTLTVDPSVAVQAAAS